nr:hypothetical protein [Mycoplasmopsis bovis]
MFSRIDKLLEANFLSFRPATRSSRCWKYLIVLFKAYKIIKVDCIFTTYNRALVNNVANVILEIAPDKSFIYQ